MGTERIDPIGAPSPRLSEKVPSYRTGDGPGDEAACHEGFLPGWEWLPGFLARLDCGAAAWRTLALGLLTGPNVVLSVFLRTCMSPALLRGLGSRSQGHSVTWGCSLHGQAPARPGAVGRPVRGTHGAAEGQEQLEHHVLGEGGVPGHQVNEALQGSPPGFDELPVG